MLEWLLKILTDAGVELSEDVKQKLQDAAPEHVVSKKDHDDLQGKYDTDTKALQKSNDALKFDSALDVALLQAGAKNLKGVKANLELDQLKLAENGALDGLPEQLEALKTNIGYMFQPAKGAGTPPAGVTPPAGDPPPPAVPATLGDAVAAALSAQK